MAAGHRYTVPAAQKLAIVLTSSPYKVLFDHGDTHVSGQLVVRFGHTYVEPKRPKQLAQLDIAVVDPAMFKVLALIEIEDTTNNPKTLIGDVMATLLGDGLALDSETRWQVGAWTSLIVFAHVASQPGHALYRERIHPIARRLQALRPHMTTANAAIERLIVDAFADQDELDTKLSQHMQAAIRANTAA